MNNIINSNIYKIKQVHHGSSHESKILDFSSSVIPLKINVKKILNKSNIFAYPDSESYELRKVIANSYNLSVENIFVGNGSSEILLYIALVFLNKGKKVLIQTPTYGEYKRTTEITGATINHFSLKETNNFKTNIDDYASYIKKSKSDIIYLCNPNNPTGDYINQDKLEYIFKKNNTKLFIIDLAYIDYTGEIINYNKYFNKYNVIFINSLTKSFGLAGLRSGFAIAKKEYIDHLQKVKIPWNMNILAQNVSIEIFKNRNKYLKNIINVKNESEKLRLKIEKTGFKTIKSSTDYFMVKVNNSLKTKEILLKQNILIRELSSLGLHNYIRITGKNKTLNKNFLKIWESSPISPYS